MNTCLFVGNLTDNPKIVKLENTFVTSFTLAVEAFRENKLGEKIKNVEFLDFDAWDSAAVFIDKNFQKGDKMVVRAEARKQSWLGKDGEKKYKTIFRVSSFNGFGTKNDES